jgi:hypothetical protein
MISELMLERYCLGETSPSEQVMIEAALVADAALGARLAALKKADEEIRGRYRTQCRRFPQVARQMRRRRRIAVGLCAAALVLLSIAPLIGLFDRFSAPTDRIKGGTNELWVYLKTDTGEAVLTDGMKLHEGNTVQLAYMAAAERYGVIFSIDGRSVVTPHYPEAGESGRLIAGRQVPLDVAYTLDDAPFYEIFFFVISVVPIDIDALWGKACVLARDPATAIEQSTALFSPYEVKTVLVEKE